MAEVLVDAPGGAFSGGGNTATGINPGGHFSGDGTGGTIGQGLNDSILWIGPAPPDPGATQFVLWINTADGRWYGKWNDGTSSQWVDLSLPFGEGKRGPIGLQGDKGDAGDVGPTGNSVIYGVVAPTTEGIDGDTYLDSATSTIYGPKAGGTWPAGVSLIGATGNDGADGTDGTNGTNGTNGTDGFTIIYGTVAPTTEGVDGDTYIDSVTDTIYGPKAGGTWPAGTSLVGPAGADGTDGTDGTDGSGVVVGGTTGQVLAKIDATDYNTEWVDQSGGGNTLYSTGLARSTGLKTSSWTLDSPNGLSTILAKKAGTTTQIWSSAGNPVGVNIANPVGINDDFDVIFDTFVYQHNDNFLMSGVYVEDVGVRQLMGTFYWNGNYGWQRYNNLVFSSENDTTTPTFTEFAYPMLGVKCYFRIIRVGDALTYYASPTGLGAIGTWDLMTTQSMSARGITDVTKIGVYSQAAAMSGTKDQGSILVGFDSGLQVENILNITETNKKVVIADYTLTNEDFFGGQILVFNSIDNITVTIPAGLTTYGPVTIISNNANTVTFVGASGVEVIGNLQLATEDSVASVVPLETDAFHMVGKLI
jgi:hypothetical protein